MMDPKDTEQNNTKENKEQPLLDYAESIDVTVPKPENETKTGGFSFKKNGGEFKISALALFVITAVIVIVTVFATFFFMGKFYYGGFTVEKSKKVAFDDKDTDYTKVAKFQEVFDFIQEDYYKEYDVNDLIEGAIEGMVSRLDDPYSKYYGPSEMNDYTQFIEGTYSGLGVTVSVDEDGVRTVSSVTENSPAALAGVEIGYMFWKIDGKMALEIDSAGFSNIFSEIGKQHEIVFKTKDGESVTKKITTAEIKNKTVFSKTINGNVMYIRISQFTEGTADDFSTVIGKIKSGGGIKSVIIDLRNNPGGFVNEAQKVADILLPEGVICSCRDRSGKVTATVKSDKECLSLPMAVLVNANTASAAELVAAAVRDFKAGAIIGVKTFGKALAQQNKTFAGDGSGIVLSVSTYYTPSGECINGVGITPDYVVELDESYSGLSPEKIPGDADKQLLEAITFLKSK